MEPWNLGQVLGLCVSALLVFHLLWIWIWPHDGIFWKRVDYFWVGFGVIGLMSAVGDIRRTQSERMIGQYQTWRNARRDEVHNAVSNAYITYSSSMRVRSDLSPPDFDSLVVAEKAFAGWCGTLLHRLPDSTAADGYVKLADTLTYPSFYADWGAFEKQWFKRSIAAAAQAEKDLATTVENARLTDLDLTLKFFGPWFMAIAVALRLTKVTGEIRLSKAVNSKPT